jgi:small subunit ribosomal protein S2
MKEYIFGERNGIYIIDLQQTLKLFKEAIEFVGDVSAKGKNVLFVGTKRQAQEAIEEEALRCGMYYVSNRWLGGLLTNFSTIRNSIKRYKELETMREEGFYAKLSKKEAARLERERKKLDKNLRGIRDMDSLPGVVFVIDSNRESIAVKEAAKLNIPVIAVVDTNSDPDPIDFVIPGNDDALRAIRLFSSTVADAVRAGRAVYDAKVEEERQVAREKAKKEEAERRAAKKAREEQLKKAAAAKAAAEAAAAEKAAEAEKAAKAVDSEKAAKAAAEVKAGEKTAKAEVVEVKEEAKPVAKKKAAPADKKAEAAPADKKAEAAPVEEKPEEEPAAKAAAEEVAETAPVEEAEPKVAKPRKAAKPKAAAASKKKAVAKKAKEKPAKESSGKKTEAKAAETVETE